MKRKKKDATKSQIQTKTLDILEKKLLDVELADAGFSYREMFTK